MDSSKSFHKVTGPCTQHPDYELAHSQAFQKDPLTLLQVLSPSKDNYYHNPVGEFCLVWSLYTWDRTKTLYSLCVSPLSFRIMCVSCVVTEAWSYTLLTLACARGPLHEYAKINLWPLLVIYLWGFSVWDLTRAWLWSILDFSLVHTCMHFPRG